MLYKRLLPGYPIISKGDMNKLLKEYTLKCLTASNFFHPNVEQFVEIAHANDEGVPMIFTELLQENLTMYVHRTRDTLHYDLQLNVSNDMAQGLHYLHSQKLAHGNLHGCNVLMTHDSRAKIADYLCPILLLTTSSPYLPPKASKDKHTTVESDVFTLAVLFLQVITRRFPQPSNDSSLSELERRSSDLQNIPKCHPLLALIEQCLSNHEVERSLMKEICDHLGKLLKENDSPQTMAFKLIYTAEYVRKMYNCVTIRIT